MKPITISARILGELALPDFCPRCFWIKLRCENKVPFQIPMPGIFNSIDAYGKKLIHGFFDQNKALPPWYPDIGKVREYVSPHYLHWSKFTVDDPKTKITVRGTPDDVFRLSDGSHHIVDYKTAKATEKQDELFPMYEVQLNLYAYISPKVGFSPITGLSLIYMEPQTDLQSDGIDDLMSRQDFSLKFEATLVPVANRAGTLIPDLLQRARKICDSARPPSGRDGCKDCKLLEKLMAVAQGG